MNFFNGFKFFSNVCFICLKIAHKKHKNIKKHFSRNIAQFPWLNDAAICFEFKLCCPFSNNKKKQI